MNGLRTRPCDCFRATCSQSRVSNRFRRFTTQRVSELARPEASTHSVRDYLADGQMIIKVFGILGLHRAKATMNYRFIDLHTQSLEVDLRPIECEELLGGQPSTKV
jgi:hypothetical protein